MRNRILFAFVVSCVFFLPIKSWSQTSPHGDMNRPCDQCHSADAWKPLIDPLDFRHDETRFKLAGRHAALDCKMCHENLKFAETSTQCADCHADIHHGELGQSCERCHTPQTWIVTDMPQKHGSTRFPLLGAHLTAPCQQCHVNAEKYQYANVPAACFDCHRQQYVATTAPSHTVAGFGTDCIQCHSPSALTWGGSFNHNLSAFPLTGAHLAVPCTQCHQQNRFQGIPTTCEACHRVDYASTKNPKHTPPAFPLECSSCHATAGWRPSSFNHGATNYPLTGMHAQAACNACHGNGVYAGTTTVCVNCHQQQYDGAVNPNHASAGFPTDCQTCHTTGGWHPSTFDHGRTAFPLTGAHLAVPCTDCHKNNVYKGTPTQCVSCHQQNFNLVASPKHVSPSFSNDCLSCHTMTAWKPSTFNHGTTKYPLTGAHTQQPCASCHINGIYVGTATVCVNCHQQQYNASVNPNHVSSGFPTDCQSCHTTSGWRPSTFDHSRTAFPLTGAHLAVPCTECHKNNVYKGTPTQCVSCHQQDFNLVVSPKHVSPTFSNDCLICHTMTAWKPSTFSHSTTTYPLTGLHTQAACNACHVNGMYAGTATVCVNCHQVQYNTSVNPNHVSSGFPTDCQSCHTTSGWRPSTFDHARTAFPLTGAHLAVLCTDCHKNNIYKGTPTQCLSCHQQDFNLVVSPKHVTPTFSGDCLSCHTMTAWKPSTFSHATTKYPLTGLHVQAACNACHVNGVYAGTSTVCVSCHQQQYNTAVNPNHISSGFPNDCQSCHATSGWHPSTFDHATTAFPLTGAHLAVPCTNCHKNNIYSGTPTQCLGCHQQDFNLVISPKHVSPAFSGTCLSCHTMTAWKPSTFSHSTTTYALTGAHVQAACNLCHVNGVYAGTPTVCVNCHQQQYNTAANPNHAGAGFPTDCQACHTTSGWSPSTFNHDPLFPISAGSKHSPGVWSVCGDCHTVPTNFKTFSCVTCHEHNQTDMDLKHSQVLGYSFVSSECYRCHPRGINN